MMSEVVDVVSAHCHTFSHAILISEIVQIHIAIKGNYSTCFPIMINQPFIALLRDDSQLILLPLHATLYKDGKLLLALAAS